MKKIPNELFFSWVDAEIAEGHSVQFRVKGNSMFPLLRNGCDQVVISPCNAQDIKPMDIVLFRYRGGHILHRVLPISHVMGMPKLYLFQVRNFLVATVLVLAYQSSIHSGGTGKPKRCRGIYSK